MRPTRAAHVNVSYGPHPHQLLDIYLPADGTGPWPVVVWFGGIWQPSKAAPGLNVLLPAHCALVAVETRTMTDAVDDKVDTPISYVMQDACRVVEFLRLNAERWNFNPRRVGAGGSSQGALPALYLACARDQANPQASDPLERQSTLLTCAVAHRSQPSIDPARMRQWVPGVRWGAPALGCGFEESLARREELLPKINRWSPDALLHAGTAPIYFENNWGLTQPEGVEEMDYKVHSPAWGLGFQQLAQAAGVECHVKYPDHPTDGYQDIWDFLTQKLNAPAAGKQ